MPSDDEWYRQRKISTLPGVRADAATILARTLEKANAGKIKSVVISIEWTDTTHASDWSNMKINELAMHGLCIQRHIQAEIFPCDDDFTEKPQA